LAKQLNKLKKKYEFLQTQYNEIASTMETLTNENEQMRAQIAKYEEEQQLREVQSKPTPVRKFQSAQQSQPVQQVQPVQPVQTVQPVQHFTLFNKPSEMVENKPEVKPPKVESESESESESEDEDEDEDEDEEDASSSEEKEKEEARNLAMKLLANKKKPTNKFLDDYLEKIN
jgi:hypothetical protein